MKSSGRDKLTMPGFCVLCESQTKDTVVLELLESADRFELLKGRLDESMPVPARAPAGRRWLDLVATDTVVVYAVSARFQAVLREAGATGWHTRAIDVGGSLVRGHELLVVTGSCGPVDDTKSGYRVQYNREGVGYPVWTGLFFDPTSWDGSDVFCPSDSGMIFITERVCEAIRRGMLENVFLRAGSDFERNAL